MRLSFAIVVAGVLVGPGLGLAAQQTAPAQTRDPKSLLAVTKPVTKGVFGRAGLEVASAFRPMFASADRTFAVRVPELSRLELSLGEPVDAGYLLANDTLTPLPAGATLTRSLFAWTPPAGSLGPHRLTFVRGKERIDVTVTVVEQPRVVEGEAQIRMGGLVAQALDCSRAKAPGCPSGKGPVTSERSVRVEGWAYDPQAAIGSGIRAVHVWAARTAPQAPAAVFLGTATLDQERPAVLPASPGAPSHAGFSFNSYLTPGTYTITAHVLNERTARFEDARSATISVK